MTIEEEYKALIDAVSWSVGVQGITKDTYIWSRSHAQDLNLDKPIVITSNVVIVIHPSVSVTITESSASSVIEYTGFVVMYSTTAAFMELALTNLKTIIDDEDFLTTVFDGITGDPKKSYFNNRAIYRWNKRIVKG